MLRRFAMAPALAAFASPEVRVHPLVRRPEAAASKCRCRIVLETRARCRRSVQIGAIGAVMVSSQWAILDALAHGRQPVRPRRRRDLALHVCQERAHLREALVGRAAAVETDGEDTAGDGGLE